MKIIIDSQQNGQSGENQKIDLNYTINNQNDKYIIYPRDISYYVGYYNITTALGNNTVTYYNGTSTVNLTLSDGLYSLASYFNAIGENNNISYNYQDYNGKVKISVTSPYTFSITNSNKNLLGFSLTQVINLSAVSDTSVNFLPYKMLYIHLKQINSSNNYFNGTPNDILARVPVTTDSFGTLVQYRFELPYASCLINTTISKLDISITDENGNIISFNGMPVFYTLEVDSKCKFLSYK